MKKEIVEKKMIKTRNGESFFDAFMNFIMVNKRKDLLQISSKKIAQSWSYFYYIRNRCQTFWSRYWLYFPLAIIGILIVASYFWLADVTKLLNFNVKIDVAENYFIGIGASLIGAGAIAFSFIMFASQINVERMPHHLFWRLSFDKRIVSSFVVIFLIALQIASFALMVNEGNANLLVLNMFWLCMLTITLVIYAYKRTISLISPIKQLTLIMEGGREDMLAWSKAADRLKPLMKEPSEEIDGRHDLKLIAFFQLHPNWMGKIKQSIDLCRAYIHRYSEYGDYVVTANAFAVLVDANVSYIKAKGRTFFTSNGLFDVPMQSDAIVNHSLEEVRQILSVAHSKLDERLMEQSLDCLANLANLYMLIDYGREDFGNKSHASLAASYLRSGVEKAVSSDLTDVGMHGARLYGQIANQMSVKGTSVECVQFIQDLTKLSAMSFSKKDNRPITQEAVRQLAGLTLNLLRSNEQDVSFALKELKRSMANLAIAFLRVPDSFREDLHAHSLAPYYSSTEFTSLLSVLTQLANGLIAAPKDNEYAGKVIRHFTLWTEDMHQTEKEVLLASVLSKSHFAFHAIHWIENISTLCLAITSSEACSERDAKTLEKNASWLASQYSWIPDELETIKFVENYQIIECMFKIAMEAGKRERWDCLEDTFDLILRWTVRSGKHETGWDGFEKGIYAVVVLTILFEAKTIFNKGSLEKRLLLKIDEIKTYSADRKTRLAKRIKSKADVVHRDNYHHSQIEYVLSEVEPAKAKELLYSVIGVLKFEGSNGKAA